MPAKLLSTTLVGSYPQPDWLIDRQKLSKQVPRVRASDLWLVAPDELEAAQDDATILAIRDQIAPPTINLDNPSVATPIDLVPHQPRKREIKVAMSNSFGFGGTNATLVMRAVA